MHSCNSNKNVYFRLNLNSIMIYSPLEYSEKFLLHGKKVSTMTVKRRCKKGLLPSGHIARKLPGKTGVWIIEIPDEAAQEDIKKDKSSMSAGHFNW